MSIEIQLADYQLRVVEEKRELKAKITALSNFMVQSPLYDVLPKREQNLLSRQLEHMQSYYEILCMRVGNWL